MPYFSATSRMIVHLFLAPFGLPAPGRYPPRGIFLSEVGLRISWIISNCPGASLNLRARIFRLWRRSREGVQPLPERLSAGWRVTYLYCGRPQARSMPVATRAEAEKMARSWEARGGRATVGHSFLVIEGGGGDQGSSHKATRPG